MEVVDRGLCRLTALALLLFLSINAIDARECKIGCHGKSNPLHNLQPGKVYQYKLEGHTELFLGSVPQPLSNKKVTGNVEIAAGANCEHVITVNSIEVSTKGGKASDSDGKLDDKIHPIPVKFGMQAGRIDDLCIDKEHVHSLNIKRAVLSLIQTSIIKDSGSAHLTETDVYGACPTNFDFIKTGSKLSVRKSKDLNKCAYRETLVNVLGSVPYFVPSDIQTSNMLISNAKIEQTFDGGVLKKAQSNEVYILNPTNALEAPATTKVTTKLELVGESAKAAPSVVGKFGKTLIYEGGHDLEQSLNPETSIADIKKIVEGKTIKKDTASIFNNLVRKFHRSSFNNIETIYNSVIKSSDAKTAKKVFHDALFSCHSSNCIKFMASLLKKGEFKDDEAKILFSHLGFAKHVNSGTLGELQHLLKDTSPTSAFLGVGMAAGRYCRHHACEGDKTVEELQKKLAGPLLNKGCKPSDKKTEDKVIASMKGVGNMHHITKIVANALIQCATEVTVKPRVRAAALDTLRQDPHRSEIKEAAGKVFRCPDTDAELRIKAYLVLAECPCGKVALWVKEVLDTDKSYQVGSFIVSHLRNVKSSTNPTKEALKRHLGAIITTKKYPFDFRKFSQNHELSYSVDMLNFGANAESNVIYSQKSYIPRSLSLNLTSQLFGHAFNWFEIDARLENVDKVVEKFLGPRGFLKSRKTNEVYDEARDYASDILEKIASRYDKSVRPKRSAITRNELDAIASKVNLDVENEDDVDIDISLKSAGNEIAWLRFHEAEAHWNTDKILDKIFGGLEKALNGAKNIDTTYQKFVSLGSNELEYGTGLGLPLKLRLSGAAALRLKIDGKLDIPAIMKDPKNSDIRFQIIPSAGADLSGDMVIDFLKSEEGLRWNMHVHTSTGTDLSFRLLDGHGFDIKIGLPVQKQEIIHFHSEVSKINSFYHCDSNVVESHLKNIHRESYSGCFDQLKSLVGLTFCGEASAPWDGFKSLSPVYGPIKLNAAIHKEDDSLNTYHIKLFYDKADQNVYKFEALLDTPNTKENRKVALTFETATKPKAYMKILLDSPWTQASFDGLITKTDSEASVLLKLKHDSTEYLIKLGSTITKNGNEYKLVPILEYKAPELKSTMIGRRGGPKQQTQTYSASGVILIEEQPKPFNRKITVQSLALNSARSKYVLDGKANVNNEGVDGDFKLSWDQESIVAKGHYFYKGPGVTSAWLSVLPSQYPDLGVDVKYDITIKGILNEKGSYASQFFFTHGPDPKSTISKLTLINNYDIDTANHNLYVENQVTYPVLNLEGHQILKTTPKSFNAGLKGKLDKYSGEIKAKGDVNVKKEGEYNFEGLAEAMGNTITVHSARKVMKNSQSKFTNSIELKPGGKYEINALVTNKKDKDNFDYQVNAEVKLPADPKLLKVDAALKQKGDLFSSHLEALAGGKEYIKVDVNLKKADSFTMNAKLLDMVNAHAESKLIDKKIKAKLDVHFPKIDKKMEGQAELLESLAKGTVGFCWDTKDPSKSIKIEFDNDISSDGATHIVSKSALTFKGDKTKLNLEYLGDIGEKGPVVREIEIILPDGHKLAVSSKGNFDGNDLDVFNMDIKTDIINHPKDQNPHILSLIVGVAPFDTKKHNFKGKIGLNYLDEKKGTLESHLTFEATKPTDKWTIKAEMGSSGSLIQRPYKAKLETELPNNLIKEDKTWAPLHYTFVSSIGSDIHIESKGKLAGNTIGGELSAKFPESSQLKSFKWSTHNELDIFSSDKHKAIFNNALTWNGDKFIKEIIEFGCDKHNIHYSAEYESHEFSKRKLIGTLTFDEKTSVPSGTLKLNWDGKTADFGAKIEQNDNEIGIILTSKTPKYGSVDANIKHQTLNDKLGAHTRVKLTTDNGATIFNSKIELEKDHPLIDISIQGKDSEMILHIKSDHIGERHWTSEMKAKWPGVDFTFNQELFLESIENFSIKSNMDAPSIDLNKVQFDVHNKPAKGEAKKISLSVKKAGSVVLAGSATYSVKEEGGHTIVEGSGSVKHEDKTYPLTYKLNYKTHGDTKEGKLAVKLGETTFNIEHRSSPTEYFTERVFCKNKSTCSKAQIMSKFTMTNEEVEQITSVIIDLSLFSPKLHDISYQSKAKKTKSAMDQTVELKWSPTDALKYKAYVHANKAGVMFTYPKRTVGVEVKYDFNKKDTIASAKIETDLWLNKEKNDKLCVLSTANINKNKDSVDVTGETKITHPALKRDLLVKGKMSSAKLGKLVDAEIVVDVFKNPNQKIVLNLKTTASLEKKTYSSHSVIKLKSEGCKLNMGYEQEYSINPETYHIKYSELGYYVDSLGQRNEITATLETSSKNHDKLVPGGKVTPYSLNKINIQVGTPEGIILLADLGYDKPKGFSNAKHVLLGTVNILGKTYKSNLGYQLNDNSLDYNLGFDGKQLECEMSAKMGNKGTFKVLWDKKEAGNIEVALDEPNFLKSKYHYNIDTIKSFFYALVDSASELQKDGASRLKRCWENRRRDAEILIKCLSECTPDFSKVREHLTTELKNIKSEILSDKSVSALCKEINEHYGKIIDQLEVLVDEIESFLKTLSKLIEESAKKASALWKEVEPQITESIDKMAKIVISATEEVVKVSKKIIDKILEQVKLHEGDIKEYLKVCTDFIHEFGKQFGKVIFAIHNEFKKLIELTIDQLKDLPLISMIKDKIKEAKEWKLPDEFWGVYTEVVENLKQLLPTTECESFITAAADYLAKVLRQEEFNAEEAGKDLYRKLEAAIRSILAKAAELVPKRGSFKPEKFMQQMPLANWLKVPRGGIRVSIINWLTSKELPSYFDIISTYHPSLNLLDNIPPFKGLGLILEGSEVITFDGRHVGFKGSSCNYVLAEDYKDRNFSIVAHIKNAKLEAITLSDVKDTVTIKPGKGTLNGKQVEYPIYSGLLAAWMHPLSYGIYSKAGVVVICSHKFDYCEVEVSGFYFNKVRGLMGNMNYEKYDDAKLPSGEIVEDDNKFGNGWKIGSCPDVTSAAHTHNRNSLCTEIFTKDYEMLIGTPWAPVPPFRAACDHATEAAPADKKLETACRIAQAYVRMARQHGAIFFQLPSKCATCSLNGQKIDDDDSKTVPYSNKEVDVVFIVEASEDNKDSYNKIFNKLVPKMKTHLESQKYTDTHFSVVSFSPVKEWPSYHTTKGSLYGTDVHIDFDQNPEFKNKTIVDRLKNAKSLFFKHNALTSRDKVYRDVIELNNFRPTARKMIVGLHSTPCNSWAPLNLISPLVEALKAQLKGIKYHLITPVTSLRNVDVAPGEIVGFTDGKVLTKAGEYKESESTFYDNDNCVEAATLSEGYVFPVDQAEANLPLIANTITHIKTDDDNKLDCSCELLLGVLPKVNCEPESIFE